MIKHDRGPTGNVFKQYGREEGRNFGIFLLDELINGGVTCYKKKFVGDLTGIKNKSDIDNAYNLTVHICQQLGEEYIK